MHHLHKHLAPLFIRLGATLLVASLFMAHAVAAELTSIVDRNEVGLNESFRLQVSYTAQVDSSKLDLSTLGDDFEVLAMRPQSNSSVSIVNGQRTQNATTTWSIILAPKRKGILSIPAFRIEQDSSSPIKVNVVDTGEAGSRDQPLLVRVSANNSSVYMGQQLIVDVQLSAQSDVGNLNGPELVIANADVIPLDQQTSQKIENGLARTVVNLKYAVFPKSAGELIIPVMTYTGSQGGQRSLFGSRGQQVVARTAQRNIQVLAASLEEQNDWFPAENVAISSKWSRDPSDLKVGEPITRTITINAVAQRAAAIPPLEELPKSANYNSYADQPQVTDKQNKRGFTGTRVESAAFVAIQAGDLLIPETRLAWFDVNENRWKESVLPAETIAVDGEPLDADQKLGLPTDQESFSRNHNSLPTPMNTLRNWLIATSVLALVALFQLFLLLRPRRSATPHSNVAHRQLRESKAWKVLDTELKNGEAKSIREALLAWLGSAVPSPTPWTLQRIRDEYPKESSDANLNSALRELESAIFSKSSRQGDTRFDRSELRGSLSNLREHIKHSDSKKEGLPNLIGLYES